MNKKSSSSFVSITLEHLKNGYEELRRNSKITLDLSEQLRPIPYDCCKVVEVILETEGTITKNHLYYTALKIIREYDYIDIKAQVMIVNLIRDSAGNNHCHTCDGGPVIYTEIVNKLLAAWPEANMVIQQEEYKSACRNKADNILYYGVSFNEFSQEYAGCDKLARIGGKIVSLRSWNTTEDYGLDPELVNFLAKCAKRQDLLLIDDAKEEDEPLLRYLSWQAECILKRESDIFVANDSYEFDWWSASSFQDIVDHVYDNLEWYYQCAKGNDTDGINGYLTEEETGKLIDNISNNCGDNIATCMMSKYAIVILSGKNLGTLYYEATEKGESDVRALMRAYRRLNSVRYRMACGFFKNGDDAKEYTPPLTANPSFNRCLLKSIFDKEKQK